MRIRYMPTFETDVKQSLFTKDHQNEPGAHLNSLLVVIGNILKPPVVCSDRLQHNLHY